MGGLRHVIVSMFAFAKAAPCALRDTMFKSPCPALIVQVGVPRGPGYQPHMHCTRGP